eukprot:15334114-Alexandrium_andersonii.AAC.1
MTQLELQPANARCSCADAALRRQTRGSTRRRCPCRPPPGRLPRECDYAKDGKLRNLLAVVV